MNTTMWTGLTLTILGGGGLATTETLIAATMVVFGLALIRLGVLMRQAEQEETAGAIALSVVVLGLLAGLDGFGRTLSEGGLALSQPLVMNVALATICSLYLALWRWEHQGQKQNRRPQ